MTVSQLHNGATAGAVGAAEAQVEALWIGGERRAARRTFTVFNPATLEPIAEVADADRDDVRSAIDAASRALQKWSDTPAPERARILRRAEALMLEQAASLARTLTLEGGK